MRFAFRHAADDTFTRQPNPSQDAPGAKRMDPRTIPAPAGVSDELRAVIRDRQIPPVTAAPTTHEGWLEFQRANDLAMAEESRVYAKNTGATYEPIEVGGVRCYLVTPKKIGDRFRDHWLVHIHGGAFVLGGGEGSVREAIWIAEACQANVLSIDYRRPPNHPFPAAIEDTVAVWKEVTQRQDAAATPLFGTSSGGNLTLATTLKLKELGQPLPGALFTGTPATDLEKTGDTWFTLEGLDPLGSYDGVAQGCMEAYVPSKDFSNPLARQSMATCKVSRQPS